MGNVCFDVKKPATEEVPDESKQNRKINKEIKKAKIAQSKYIKVLLLGTGESGKSTIVRQVRQLYGQKLSDKEIAEFKPKIYINICGNVIAMLNARGPLGITLENEKLAEPFLRESFKDTADITPELGDALQKLWEDEGMQELWARRNEYQVFDNMEYYMQNMDRIGVGIENYKAVFQDCVQCRVRTAGAYSIKFQLEGTNFVMFDVGGQRSERNKWINCFDSVMTMIFVAAINEYDQKLFEDGSTNRVTEAVQVWQDIVNRETFNNVGFVLLLNKYDLFQKKVSQYAYRDDSVKQNMTYTGAEPKDLPDGAEREAAMLACAKHAKNRFFDVIEVRTGFGTISAHFSNATDQESMIQVFQNAQDNILKKHLYYHGLPVS